MRRRLRQAGVVAGHVSHHGLRLVGTLALVALLLLGGAAWRLSRGPVDLPPLATRIGAAASGEMPGLTVTIEHAGLAWEGFHKGGAPVDLRLAGIVIHNHAGAVAARISKLRVTLAVRALLRGRIAPVRIIAHDPAIAFRPTLDAPSGPAVPPRAVGALVSLISQVPHAGKLDLSSLRRIRIAHAHLTLEAPDDPSSFIATDGTLLFNRTRDGTMRGAASAHFRYGTTIVPLTLSITGHHGLGHVKARLGPVDPSRVLAADDPFARFHLPLSLTARWPVGRFAVPKLDLGLTGGAGRLDVASGSVPVEAVAARATATVNQVTLTRATIRLAGPAGAEGPAVRLAGVLSLHGALPGSIDIGIDRVEAAELARYWPQGVAEDARRYIIGHITSGTARHGAFHAEFDAAHADLAPGAVTGGFTASGVAIDWFKDAPPIIDLAGKLRFTHDDAVAIEATSGRLGALAVHGHMRITTLSRHDQDASIVAEVTGGLGEAIRALRAPPLRLKATGIPLDQASGRIAATIDAHLPLKKHLALGDIDIRTTAALTAVHLPLPIAPLALDQGQVALSVDPHNLALHGTGRIDGNAARFTAAMALPDGRLDLAATTTADRHSLAAFGVKPDFWQAGTAPLTIHYRDAKAGGTLEIGADLTGLALAAPAFGWRKAAGAPGHGVVRLRLAAGRFDGLRSIAVNAPGLAFAGTRNGASLAITKARLGTLSASGRLTPPEAAGKPWRLALAGDTLDLSALIARARATATAKAPAAPPAAPPPPAGDTPWRLRGTFAHLRLHKAPAAPLGPVQIAARGDATGLASLAARLRVTPGKTARLNYDKEADGTHLKLAAADAGALLAALDATNDIIGGTLALTATRKPATTAGKLVLSDFRLRRAPTVAKVLQGLTLYGVPAATSGPGLQFTTLIAPFSFAGTTISLGAARAHSPSLGFTATGQIDLGAKRYNLSGTIVPAYVLNTLPGRIPLIGRLFSPEKGGGLFAARYTVEGPFASPKISVNPVSALAPGFIRDIFGIGPPERPATPPAPAKP